MQVKSLMFDCMAMKSSRQALMVMDMVKPRCIRVVMLLLVLMGGAAGVGTQNLTEIKTYGMVHPLQPILPDRTEMVTAIKVSSSHTFFTGVTASVSIWKPFVEPGSSVEQGALSSCSIGIDNGHGLNVHAGWMVMPSHYGDNNPHAFVSWKEQGSMRGCVDQMCPGFVQYNNSNWLGRRLVQSRYDFVVRYLKIRIERNPHLRHWEVTFNNKNVGYWPFDLFNNSDLAMTAHWTGSVRNAGSGPQAHTQMGSGHFPNEGYRRAANIDLVQFLDENGRGYPPANLQIHVTRPHCYNMVLATRPQTHDPRIFFGGPGGEHCY